MTAGARLIVPLVTPFTKGCEAGVRLRGIGVGVPRLPGQDLLPAELQALLSRQS